MSENTTKPTNQRSDTTDRLVPHSTVVPVERDGALPPASDPATAPPDVDTLRAENEQLKKKLGTQGNELGELRRAVQAMQAPKEDPDYFADPENATREVIQSEIEPLKAELAKTRQRDAITAVTAKHPDHEDVISSEGFRDWVLSSRSRMLLAAQAERESDAELAIELLDQYKASGNESPQDVIDRDRKARAGLTERGSGQRVADGVFSMSEMRRLQQQDPARYRALSQRFMRAIKDGRVTD